MGKWHFVQQDVPMQLIPTILCGGAGSRLWPWSRGSHPKPFIRLNDGESLIQKAFLRSAVQEHVTEILTLSQAKLVFQIQNEYAAISAPHHPQSFILEPCSRNTAPAIAAAALFVQRKYGDDAVLLILPADHLIPDLTAFTQAVQAATRLAQDGHWITFGILPERPETGYGYIEADPNSTLRFGAYGVKRFVEKPNADRAKLYVNSPHFFWNAGLFCGSAGTIANEIKNHQPVLFQHVQRSLDEAKSLEQSGKTLCFLNEPAFEDAEDISIDYAVLEHSDRVAVLPAAFAWNDLGSWLDLSQLTTPDEQGNRTQGPVLLEETQNCRIYGENRLIAALGIDDLLVIDTADALLITRPDKAQAVKKLYQTLKDTQQEVHEFHRTIHRPWGTYTILEEGAHFKIKRLWVKPHASLSLQRHAHRSEHWVVVTGCAEVTKDEATFFLHPQESIDIPKGCAHRLANPSDGELIIIEVQNGAYLGEDDIVRLDDPYGREHNPHEAASHAREKTTD